MAKLSDDERIICTPTLAERERFFLEGIPAPEISDLVNHPSHYTKTKPETIDLIESILTPEEFRGYCKGNMIKYRDRAGHKDNAQQDYDKAKWYYIKLKGRE